MPGRKLLSCQFAACFAPPRIEARILTARGVTRTPAFTPARRGYTSTESRGSAEFRRRQTLGLPPVIGNEILKVEPHAELNLTLRKRRREAERLARGKRRGSVHVERRSERRTDDVVHARIIRPVRDIESFRQQLQSVPLADFESPAEPHIEINQVWTDAAVARRAWRAIVREVIILVDIGPGQKIERMSAVVRKERR